MMTLKHYLHIWFVFFVFFAATTWSQEPPANLPELNSVSQELFEGRVIELKELEIRAKIHEPMVIYILDAPNSKLVFERQQMKLSEYIFDDIGDYNFD